MSYYGSDGSSGTSLALVVLIVVFIAIGTSSDDTSTQETQNVVTISYQAQHQQLVDKANTLNEAHIEVFGESFFANGSISVEVNNPEEARGAKGALEAAIYKLEAKLGLEQSVPKPTVQKAPQPANTAKTDGNHQDTEAKPSNASDIANGILRQKNEALKAELAEVQAQLEASQKRTAELKKTLAQIAQGLQNTQQQLKN